MAYIPLHNHTFVIPTPTDPEAIAGTSTTTLSRPKDVKTYVDTRFSNVDNTSDVQKAAGGPIGDALDAIKALLTVDVRSYGLFVNIATTTAAFQAAIDDVFNRGGGVVQHAGNYHLNNISVKRGVNLKGPHENPGEILPGVSANYGNQIGVLWVASGQTITNNGAISGAIIIREGLVTPFADPAAAAVGVAAFAGTAISFGAQDASASNLLILGFAQAISSVSKERPHIFNVRGDCTSGIRISNCFDIAICANNHFWPFLTVHQTWTLGNEALLTRTGTAYRYDNVGDWNKIFNNFSYGYAVGHENDSCNSVTMISCGADYPPSIASTSIGFNTIGTSKESIYTSCQAAAQGTGFYYNSSGGNHQLNGGSGWANDNYHVRVEDGSVRVNGNMFRGGGATAAVAVGAGADYAAIDGNTFDSITGTTVSINPAVQDACTVGLTNMYINCSEVAFPFFYAAGLTHTRVAASASGPNHTFRKARGTRAAPAIVSDGDVSGGLAFEAHDGAVWRQHALFRVAVDGVPGSGDMPGRFEWYTSADGGVTLAERLRIRQDGVIAHRANATVIVDANSHLGLRSYTVATLPSAATAARLITVSDGASNKRLAISEGTNWRWPDGAIVS